MPFRQGQFQYHPMVLDALESTISSERLSTYLKLAGFDRERAVRMYIWNTYISECFHFPLQGVEVTLRNSVNELLFSRFGDDWPTSKDFLNLAPARRVRTEEAIAKVVGRIESDGHLVTTGRIVAGLTFDFWVGLLSSKYGRSLWQGEVHSVFENFPRESGRRQLHEKLSSIKEFRNRVAHYEPILKNDLSGLHTDIVSVIGYRCAHTARWVAAHSKVQQALRAKP